MQKILIIGECKELLPLLEKLVKENNYHIWFISTMQEVTDLVKENDINMILINFSGSDDARLLYEELKNHKKTKEIRTVLYNPNINEGQDQGKGSDDLQESSFNTQQIESILS